MAQQLTDLSVDRVSVVDRAAVRDPQHKSEPRRLLFWKREGGQTNEGDDMPEATATVEELQAALAKAERDRDSEKTRADKAEEEAEKARKSSNGDGDQDQEEEGEVSKADLESLPEGVRAILQKSQSRAEAAERIAKAEQDLRLQAEFVTKAEGIYHAVGDPAVAGPVLKSIHESVSKEAWEWLDGTLEAAHAQIEKGDLFSEIGRGGDAAGLIAPSGAFEELTRKAEDIRKADSSMSSAQAMERAMLENPDLQQRYLAAERGA